MTSTVEFRPRPVGQSAFLLPAFTDNIPVAYTDALGHQQAYAKFILAAEKCGVEMPVKKCDSLTELLELQWEAFYASRCDRFNEHVISCRPQFVMTKDEFKVEIRPAYHLNIVHLKPVIEGLEALMPGAGWFVVSVIEQASGHDMRLYDHSFLAEEAMGSLRECTDDQEFVRTVLAENREESYENKKIPAKVMKKVRAEERSFPSDYLREVGGHKHLLGWGDETTEKLALSDKQVIALIASEGVSPNEMRCLTAALALKKAFAKDKACPFNWNPYEALRSEDDESDGDEEVDPYQEPVDLIGAACFVAWDDFQWLTEAVSHFERRAMECGTSEEALGHQCIPLDSDEVAYEKLARDLRAYLETWILLDRLLSEFPINEGCDDEV